MTAACIAMRSGHRQDWRSSPAFWLHGRRTDIAGGGIGDLWPVISGAMVLAAIGWMDDRTGLPALARLTIELAVAAALVVHFFGTEMLLSPAGVALLLGGLWFINLFNFMDGSDGLAASQAIIGLLPWISAIMLGFLSGTAEIGAVMGALAGACLGLPVLQPAAGAAVHGRRGEPFHPRHPGGARRCIARSGEGRPDAADRICVFRQ